MGTIGGNAAIYARKSNAQNVPDEARSGERQIDGARAFIAAQGWTLNPAHIYTDDGVSGALFASREQFQRLMRDAETGAFHVVVLYDLDRFGRNAQKTMVALNALADMNVSVWDYSTGRPVDLDSFEGETLTFLKARFAQQYRDQVRKHTRDAMRQKFLAGFVVGGKVFGYDNVTLAPGQTIRRVNDSEAAIVREIYERYARGEGYRAIAWELNRRKVPAPRAQRGRPSGWEASTIRALLDRPLYRGYDLYGRTRKAYGRELGARSMRERGQLPKVKDDWLRREFPELQIIDDAVIAAVDTRRGDRSSRYLQSMQGQKVGRPSAAVKYLLSGFLVCPCGARFEALKTGSWSHPAGAVYVCAAHRRKGPSVCANTLALPIDYADDVVLTQIEGEVLTPRFIERVLDSAFAGTPDDTVALQAERDALAQEIQNITQAIAVGGDIPQLVQMLKERDRKLRALDARLTPVERPDRHALRLALEQRVSEWRDVLRQHPRQARMVLQQLIDPIYLHSEEDRPAWLAKTRPEGLLAGMVHGVASPPGFEPGFQP